MSNSSSLLIFPVSTRCSIDTRGSCTRKNFLPDTVTVEMNFFFSSAAKCGVSYLRKKMKKELSILCGNPQSREEVTHASPEMFVMVIHRRGMVRLGLGFGPLAGRK